MQATESVLMISPVAFSSNSQARVDNVFMNERESLNLEEIVRSHQAWVDLLRSKGVHVVLETHDKSTPDAVFPNNWILFHHNVKVLFPMKNPVRRLERRKEIMDKFPQYKLVDLAACWEEQNLFLEGTGSLVIDWQKNVAFVCLSQRSSLRVAEDFVDKFAAASGVRLKLVTFEGRALATLIDITNAPVYHTNVVMAIAEKFVVCCLEVVTEKENLLKELSLLDKKLIFISSVQMDNFCGNILQVSNLICMSTRAFRSFSNEQLSSMKENAEIVHSQLDMLEEIGGGGIRCCICEIF